MAASLARIGKMKTEIGIVNSKNISTHMISNRFLHGQNIPKRPGKLRDGSIPTNGSDMSLLLSMNSLSGTITDLTAAWISIILNLRNSHSGEDYLKRLSSVSVSEFLVGELMKRSSYLKLRSMRNRFRTAHLWMKSKFARKFLIESSNYMF